MLLIASGTRLKVKKLEHRDKYTIARFSSSEKKFPADEAQPYEYSTWSFVNCVGQAHTFLMEEAEEGDIVEVVFGKITNAPYSDPETDTLKWAKSPKIVLITLKMYRKGGAGKSASSEDEPNPYE